MLRLLLLSLWLFFGCATLGFYSLGADPYGRIDKTLVPYLTLFLSDAEEFGVEVKARRVVSMTRVSYDEMKLLVTPNPKRKNQVIGLCRYPAPDNYDEVELYVLGGLGGWTLQATMYHELAHCLLGADHYGDGPKEGSVLETDLMNSTLPDVDNETQMSLLKERMFLRMRILNLLDYVNKKAH